MAQSDTTLPEQYLDIYTKMHDAEMLERKSDYSGALKGFQDCQAGFEAIHNADPDWEPALVGHRLADVKVTIERLQKEVAERLGNAPDPDASILNPTPATPAAGNPPPVATPPKTKIVYPWHTAIPTTLFWIGSKSVANAWSLPATKGGDDPEDRNGYASGKHASYFNTFYVALPFNDLTNPDKSKQYIPASWKRPPKTGKPVSICQGHWVEIKTDDGHICYGQWEDVGPRRSDHAEYVFGMDRPADGVPGLALSPAVYSYLGLKDANTKQPLTSWRFVDNDEVPPGQWLKLDEEAVIYTAMHQMKDTAH